MLATWRVWRPTATPTSAASPTPPARRRATRQAGPAPPSGDPLAATVNVFYEVRTATASSAPASASG